MASLPALKTDFLSEKYDSIISYTGYIPLRNIPGLLLALI